MKVIDTPRTNKIGNMVAYISPYGQCYRTYCVPRNRRTPAQSRMRSIFGSASHGWGLKLTEPQREHWMAAALQVPSHPSLGQYSHLSGQQLCVKINSTLRCIGQTPVGEPPAPVAFSPNPVGDVVVVNDESGGVRLLLTVSPAAEDIMLFGQAPCSVGRMKHRRVCYLGLLGPATSGQCDITAHYTGRFGQPSPGQKVFIVTCQVKNGWKGQDHLASAIIPPRTGDGEQQRTEDTKVQETAANGTPESQVAPAEAVSSAPRAVYKGCTPDARELHTAQERVYVLSTLCAPLVHGLRMAMGTLRRLEMAGTRVWRTYSPASPALKG